MVRSVDYFRHRFSSVTTVCFRTADSIVRLLVHSVDRQQSTTLGNTNILTDWYIMRDQSSRDDGTRQNSKFQLAGHLSPIEWSSGKLVLDKWLPLSARPTILLPPLPPSVYSPKFAFRMKWCELSAHVVLHLAGSKSDFYYLLNVWELWSFYVGWSKGMWK